MKLTLLFVLVGCLDNPPSAPRVCAPDETRTCLCEAGPRAGQQRKQTCAADGQSWSACGCGSLEQDDSGEVLDDPDREPR